MPLHLDAIDSFKAPFDIFVLVGEDDRRSLSEQGVDLSNMKYLFVSTDSDEFVLADPSDDQPTFVGDVSSTTARFLCVWGNKRWREVMSDLVSRFNEAKRWHHGITFRGQVVSLAVITENPPPR